MLPEYRLLRPSVCLSVCMHAAALRFGWIGSSRRYDYYYGKAKRTHRASEQAQACAPTSCTVYILVRFAIINMLSVKEKKKKKQKERIKNGIHVDTVDVAGQHVGCISGVMLRQRRYGNFARAQLWCRTFCMGISMNGDLF